jgi:hypothetical protein
MTLLLAWSMMASISPASQGEDGFARARAADEQARAVARQPAAAQLIESLDAGR